MAYKMTAVGLGNSGLSVFILQSMLRGMQYLGKDGKAVTKRFEHTEISSRAKLLLNTITDEIDSMGRSISEQEKRQVLMEVLKNML